MNNESESTKQARNRWEPMGIPYETPTTPASSRILPAPKRPRADWSAIASGDQDGQPQIPKNDWSKILGTQPTASSTSATPALQRDWSFLEKATSPNATLRDFAGKDATPEQALESGAVQQFLDQLRAKSETMEPDSDERNELAKRIAGLQSDLGEFNRQEKEAAAKGVSRQAIQRLESPIGSFEREISQTAIGQTALAAEQGASDIAETLLSQSSRAFGEGKMSARIHKETKLREEFLQAAEQGGQIEQMLGATGSRLYNSAIRSISKNAMVGTVAGPSAVYSLIAAESHDDALEEARVGGLSGKQAQVFAASKAGAELGVSLLLGRAAKKIGVTMSEQMFSPGMKKAAAKLVNNQVGSQLPKWAAEAAGVGMETGEELTVDAIHQGIEFAAGTSKGFNWQRWMEAGATGGLARGAMGGGKTIADRLRKIPQQNIVETVKGVVVAEQAVAQLRAKEAAPAVADPAAATLASPEDRAAFEKIAAHQVQVEDAAGARGLNRALRYIESATPQMLEAARQPLTSRQFQELTGIKKTSAVFRAAFSDTLNLYAGVQKSQNEAPNSPARPIAQQPATTHGVESESIHPFTIGTQQPAAPASTAALPPAADFQAQFQAASPTTKAGAVRTWLKSNLTSAGLRNAEIDGANDQRLGRIASELMQADHLRGDFDAAVKAELGGRGKLTPDQVRKIDDALKGRHTDLPQSVLATIEPMRAHVDALSRRLMDSGVVDPESELGITIDENMGSYLTRTYRKHDDKTWMQTAKANGDLMDRARAWLRAEHPGESADVTEWRLNTMLDKDSAAAKAPAGVAKADSNFASLLKERKDLPDIVRELYGEYRDPWINYTKSIAKMANLIAHKQFMATVKQAGLQTGFLSAADAPNPHHFRQIDPATTPRLAELAGLYTDPATAKSLQDLFSAETHSQLYRYAVKLSALAKMNATIFNSKVHVRNALGNLQFAFANGDFFQSPAVWAKSAKLTIDHLLNRGDDGARQYVRRLAELRLADSTVEVNELRAMAEDMIDLDAAPREGAWAKLKGGAGDVVAGASRLYQSQDTFWKILGFENKKTQYARAYPDKDFAAIEMLAAADVRAHYPSYDKLPKLVRDVSQFPLAAPFISFPAESIRTLKNSLATIQREIASDNPAIREMGMSRAVGLVSSFALVPAIAAISKAIVGITPEEEEDLRKFQAPWAANAQFLYLGKDGEGNYDSLDLSFLDARSTISKPLLGMLRSGGWEDRFDRAVAELTAPLGEDLFFGRALSVLRNKTADGRPVYIEQADDVEKLRQLGWFMGQPMIPGTIQQLDRIRKGAQGEVSKGGKPYDAQLEAAALLGLRVSSADTKQSFGFRSMDMAVAMSRAEQGIAQVASSRGTITPGQLADAYTMYNQQRAKLVQDWHEMAMSAIRLGVPQAEVYRSVLTTAGERDALMIISGRYQAYRPSEQLLRTVTSRPDGQSRALQLVQLHRETTEQIVAELAMGR